METPDMDLAMETLSIVRDSADHHQTLARLPLPVESSSSDLRTAIQICRDADDRARAASELAACVADDVREASMIVDRVKREIDAIQRDAKEMDAEACARARRAGLPLPPAPSPCLLSILPP
jgi:hypothetical protein